MVVFAGAQWAHASEIMVKSENLAAAYQQAEGLDDTEAGEVALLLQGYFTTLSEGGIVSPAVQTEVDGILAVLAGLAVPSATTVQFSFDGTLSGSSPTFNRPVGAFYDAGDICRTQATLSTVGTNVYYQVIPFTVQVAGDVDIEVMTGTFDTYLILYCAFDPDNPLDNLVASNDDGGEGLYSRINVPNLPAGAYYAVVSSFGNDETGSFTVEFRSDSGVLYPDHEPAAVPLSTWWVLGVFMALGLVFSLKRLV